MGQQVRSQLSHDGHRLREICLARTEKLSTDRESAGIRSAKKASGTVTDYRQDLRMKVAARKQLSVSDATRRQSKQETGAPRNLSADARLQ